MGLIFAGDTDVGKKRSSNQDSIYMNQEYHLYIVADGMGGHNGGDIASKMAIDCVSQYIKTHFAIQHDPQLLLQEAVIFSNQKILEYANQYAQLKGMGTTLVILFFKESTLYIANVGDSRAYLVNKGNLYQLTSDHSLVQEKINHGIYTREQAKNDKMKNVLVKAIGHQLTLEVDIFTYTITKNDLFFICSDGLHGKVSARDILSIIGKNIPDPSTSKNEQLVQAVKNLIDQANINGGQDNISVIMAITQ